MEETSMIVSPCVPSIDTSPSLLSISFCPFTFATVPNNQIQEALFLSFRFMYCIDYSRIHHLIRHSMPFLANSYFMILQMFFVL